MANEKWWYLDDDEGDGDSPPNTLAALFRSLSYAAGCREPADFERLLLDYVETIKQSDKARKTSYSGNTRRGLQNDEMTIKNFMIGMQMLKFDGIKIEVTAYRGDSTLKSQTQVAFKRPSKPGMIRRRE